MTIVFGAYWGPREESREGAAARVAGFLDAVGRAHGTLSTWYLPMAKAQDPRIPLDASPGGIVQRLKPVNRTRADLGFGMAAWNESGRFDATLGLHFASPHLRNAATLLFDADPKLSALAWRELMTTAIEAFDPDHVTVTAKHAMAAHPGALPWTLGWWTFERGARIVEHPERAP